MYTFQNEKVGMKKKEHGIILRFLSSDRKKCSVLTPSLGKISAIIKNKHPHVHLQQSSTISFYYKDSHHTTYLFEDVGHGSLPLSSIPNDMYWVHHLLELCYYFIPPASPCPTIFIFLSTCFAMLNHMPFTDEEWAIIKKICIGILACLLGFFPPASLQIPINTVKSALLLFIDFEDTQKVESFRMQLAQHALLLEDMDTWLLECIYSHPSQHSFKTIKFIYTLP